MKNFRELTEQKDNVVFTFGRFNPPTTGHEKLIQKVKSVAGSSPYRIYPSQSQNQKKDPLPHALKIAYMRKMFSKHARNIVADKDSRTAIDIAVKLYDEGFKNLTMVVGSDRVKEFERLLKTYNGVEGKRHGYYKFDSINVVSAGERDPDAEGVEGMSASKMRMAASDGDLDSFQQGLPSGFKDGKKLYLDVRKYMGIREQRNMGRMSDFETLRDMYLTGHIWNIDDMVEANGVEGKIIRRGTNYIAFNDRDGKVHKAWLHEVKYRVGNKDNDTVHVDANNPKDAVKKALRKGFKDTGMISTRKGKEPFMVFDTKKREFVDLDEIQKGLRRVKQDPDIKGDPGTEPAKYYKGVAKSKKPARDDHFEKGAKMDDDNPAAYTPAPGDKDKSGKLKKTKPSKYTLKYKKMFGDEFVLDEKIAGLVKKADKSGVSYSILKQVYNRGMAAWRTGHRPGTTPQQWAFARVNSFLTGGGARKADADLWSKAKASKKSKKEEVAALLKPPVTESIELNEAEYVNFGIPDNWEDKKGVMDNLLGKFNVSVAQDIKRSGDVTVISVAKDLAVKFRNELKRKKVPFASDEEPIKKKEIKKDIKSIAKRITQKLLRKNELKKFSDINEWGQVVQEAEYEGRDVKLNDPFRLPSGSTKKFGVYVKNEKGNVVKVTFGDPNMEIKRDDPENRKSFRARHNCDDPGPKYKARYWSCFQWRAGSKVDN